MNPLCPFCRRETTAMHSNAVHESWACMSCNVHIFRRKADMPTIKPTLTPIATILDRIAKNLQGPK